MKRIKVYLVDDHRMMLDMWNSLLSIDNRFSVVGISTDGRLALEEIKVKLPNVVLMDISMPGISGIDLTRTIKEKFPLTQVLAVSMHTNVLTIKQILSAGASGYMSKTSSFDEMVQAILAVYEGKHYIAEDIKNLIAEQILESYHALSHTWRPQERFVYHYNPQNERDTITYFYDNNGNWEPYERLVDVVYHNLQEDQFASYRYQEFTGTWDDVARFHYTYSQFDSYVELAESYSGSWDSSYK